MGLKCSISFDAVFTGGSMAVCVKIIWLQSLTKLKSGWFFQPRKFHVTSSCGIEDAVEDNVSTTLSLREWYELFSVWTDFNDLHVTQWTGESVYPCHHTALCLLQTMFYTYTHDSIHHPFYDVSKTVRLFLKSNLALLFWSLVCEAVYVLQCCYLVAWRKRPPLLQNKAFYMDFHVRGGISTLHIMSISQMTFCFFSQNVLKSWIMRSHCPPGFP